MAKVIKFLRINDELHYGFVEYHFYLLPKGMLTNNPSIKGGGKITINLKERTIIIDDKSQDFRQVNPEFIKKYFADGKHLEDNLWMMVESQKRIDNYKDEIDIKDFTIIFYPYNEMKMCSPHTDENKVVLQIPS